MQQSVEFCAEQANKCLDQAGWTRDQQSQNRYYEKAAEWLRLAEEARKSEPHELPDAPRMYIS
jgi:hypothetical protein